VAECPVNAIFAELDVPAGQEHFLEVNAELAKNWPVIASKIPEMDGADLWDGVPNKLPLLDKGDGSTWGDTRVAPSGAT
jgi:ferredoxin